MAGFFGGLAEGLGQGIQFASQQRARELQAQREAAYEQNLQSQEARRSAQTEAGLKLQDRQQHLDAYKELHNRINELGTQYAGGTPPPEALDEMKTLREQERALTGQLFPAATQSHTDARQTATDMASGNAKPKAEDVYNMLSQATGRPANELVSTDGKPTPTQQALNDFTQGMQNLQTDHGQQALRGLNTLYGDELHGYVGHALPGGGTVAAAEFAPPVPMQGGGMAPVIKLTSDNGSVRYVPLLSDQQSPEGNDLVHTVGLDKVLNHVNALQTVTHMVNADPTLKAVALSGNPDKAREALDARRVATAPAKQSMFMSPEELAAVNQARTQAGFGPIKTTTYVDKYGNEKVAPGGPGGLHEVAVNPRQAELDAAELAYKHAETQRALREPAGKAGAPGASALAQPDVTDLLSELAVRGVKLPVGLRSKDVLGNVAQALIKNNPDLTPAEIADKVRDGSVNLSAVTRETAQAAAIAGRVSTAVNELSEFGPLVLQAAKLVPRGSFMPVNKLLNMADEQIGDPNLRELKVYINGVRNAYDLLAARGGTDIKKREENRKLLDSADSPEALAAAVKALQTEGAAAGRAASSAMKPTADRFTINAPSRGGLAPGAEGTDAAPEGVPADAWQHMTPEERALWQK